MSAQKYKIEAMNSFESLAQKFEKVVPIIYAVADDEHRIITKIHSMVSESKKVTTEIVIHRSTQGLLSYDDYLKEIKDKKDPVADSSEINTALRQIYTQRQRDRRQIYIINDADIHLENDQVVRRIKDFAIQADNDDDNLKIIILLSSRLNLPAKLEKYVEVITLPYPDEDEIRKVAADWVGRFNEAASAKNKVDTNFDHEIINSLKGLTTNQIRSAITSCLTITKGGGKQSLDAHVLNELKREVVNKTSMLQIVDSKATFDTVGGYSRIKEWYRKSSGGWTNEGREYGLPHLKGILEVGLPGCGKTELAKALANEWKLNLVKFDPSNVFSSRVGESESNMARAISIIESLAPCVLFIDEMEKGFAGMQSSSFSDAGTTARVIGKFLMWMQDSEAAVFTVATVNHIQYLPAELISRFDEVYFFNLPSVNECKSILNIQLKNFNRDPKKFDLDRLAQSCKNLSGREIMQAVKEALYDAYNQKDRSGNRMDINTEILEKALKKKTPVMKTMEDQLRYVINWVGYDQKSKDGIRARFANDPVEEEDMDDFLKILEEEFQKKSQGPNSVDWGKK